MSASDIFLSWSWWIVPLKSTAVKFALFLAGALTEVVFGELWELKFACELLHVVVRAAQEEDRLQVREALLRQLVDQLDEVDLALQDDGARVDDRKESCEW